MLPYWAAWLSISIWIDERQLNMSAQEEEEVLWETSARHLCFRFLTHFCIADLRGYSKLQTFSNSHRRGLAIQAEFFHHNMYCLFAVTSSSFPKPLWLYSLLNKAMQYKWAVRVLTSRSMFPVGAKRPGHADISCHMWLMPVMLILPARSASSRLR